MSLGVTLIQLIRDNITLFLYSSVVYDSFQKHQVILLVYYPLPRVTCEGYGRGHVCVCVST